MKTRKHAPISETETANLIRAHSRIASALTQLVSPQCSRAIECAKLLPFVPKPHNRSPKAAARLRHALTALTLQSL